MEDQEKLKEKLHELEKKIEELDSNKLTDLEEVERDMEKGKEELDETINSIKDVLNPDS